MTYSNFVLKNVKDVKNLNKEATKADFDVKVSAGSIIVDAKSLLALLALIGRKITLIAPDHLNPEHFQSFIKRIS